MLKGSSAPAMSLHRCFCFQILAPLPFTKAWRLDTICSLAANKYQKNKCLGIEVETRDCISKKGSMEKSLPLKCEINNICYCVSSKRCWLLVNGSCNCTGFLIKY